MSEQMTTLEVIKAYIEESEKTIDHPYPDINGHVTIGIGQTSANRPLSRAIEADLAPILAKRPTPVLGILPNGLTTPVMKRGQQRLI